MKNYILRSNHLEVFLKVDDAKISRRSKEKCKAWNKFLIILKLLLDLHKYDITLSRIYVGFF